MRLGKISVSFEYVVDLDNEEMVDHAKEAIVEDIDSAIKYMDCSTYGGFHFDIDTDGEYGEGDIAEFLTEDTDY